jgi:polyisoprenoid-binding protein YceI
MTTLTKLTELTGDYAVDTARTRIGFAVRLMMVTKVAGQFGEFEGSVHLDGDDPSKSSVQLTIQAASIQTRNKRRDDHLRSSFLDAGRHPAITFSSARVDQAGATTFTVTGGLAIRGVTKPVTVDLELTGAEPDPRGSFRVGFAGQATISRTDWGVSWNAALEGGGALVGDRVTLELSIIAVRPS